MTYAVLDVETSIKQSYKRKANPFDPENWTVWIGEHQHGKEPYFEKHKDKAASKGWLARFFKRNPECKVLITFNGKFDVLHGIADDPEGLDAWMDFINRGGQLWDAQLAEYLLMGQDPSSHMLSLDETCVKYGGVLKPDAVKDLWNAGVETVDISDDLMMEYLPGDIENTRKTFLGQVVKAQQVGQQRSIMLNMGALVFTIESERNGMKADVELGMKLAAELEEELAALMLRLDEYLPEDLPFEFNWGSRIQLSAMLFGGAVNYKSREPILNENFQPTYAQKTEAHYLTADGGTISQDAYNTALLAGDSVPTLVYFSSGKNAGEPKTKQVKVDDFDKPKSRLEDRTYQFPGYTKPSDKWKTATPGVYQTGSAIIEALGNRDIPFLKDLARRAKLDKDLGTYFIKTDDKGKQTGMLTLVHPDGLIHHMINMTSTVTGRFSSSNPNMQNLPKAGEGKSKAKEMFVSRFGPDGVIIQSDFSSLEIYIQAILTKCKQMIVDLLAGLDMHVARVATTAGIDYDEAYRLCHTKLEGGAAEFPEWVSKRTKAKVFSFQRAYGAGAAKISESTGIPIDEVYALIEAENTRYPEIEPFYADLMEQVTNSKRGCRKVIPHPDFPAKQVALGTGHYRTPDGKLYTYLEQCAPKFVVEKTGQWSSFSPTEIKNYIVQGTGAEWAKAACWLLVRMFYRRKNWGGLGLLINQVHDAAYGDAHPSVKAEVAAVIHACMEGASPFMSAYFNWAIPLPVPSDTTWGASMAEDNAVADIDTLAEPFRAEIHTHFIAQYL
ncbi:DNA polymerase I [Pseudomonas phage BIM BV-45]|nr:DNA polymerase I [Pseudomonas phage BIM BV-45]